VIDNGLSFINSSSQVSPTAFVLPTTPAPMPSANLFYTLSPSFYASFGFYYSNQSVGFGNLIGSPQSIQLSESGSFLIGEPALKWQHAPLVQGGGNLKLGAWGHTGTFPPSTVCSSAVPTAIMRSLIKPFGNLRASPGTDVGCGRF
jgi:hypothetical protein